MYVERIGGGVNLKKEFVEWLLLYFVVVFVLQVIVSPLLMLTIPISNSMEPAIRRGTVYPVLKQAYRGNEPDRFDVIVFELDVLEYPFIKRVIGLPGEQVEVVGGEVFINGKSIKQAENFEKSRDTSNYGPEVIPDGCYFVMGDNRGSSLDSRYDEIGFIDRGAIMGKIPFK